MNLHAGFGCVAQPEMQARIVRGKKAGLAGQGLRLNFPSVAHEHSRANCAAIAFRSLQPHFDPMIPGGRVVAQ
jgi:hypothetical protein